MIDEIRTDRLTLRRTRADDWVRIREIWLDFSDSAYSVYDTPKDTSPDAVRARIRRWADESGGTEHMFFSVLVENVMIGFVSLNARPSGYEMGYCFHSAYHGRGYASESVTALMKALAGCGVRKITAGTALDNLPSVKLLKTSGFVLTGTESVSFYVDEHGKPIYFEGGLFEKQLNGETDND